MTGTVTSSTARERRMPLSPAQAGLWFASVHGADPAAYNQPLVLDVPQLLDHPTLAAAVRHVTAEHESLRSTFEMGPDGTVTQVVHPDAAPWVELDERSGGDVDRWLEERTDEVARTVFDLADSPLARLLHLRQPGRSRSRLVFNLHHIVFDGMSWKPYLSRIEEVYGQLRAGTTPTREHPRQAGEVGERWNRKWTGTREPALEYWRSALAGAPRAPRIGLPGNDGDRPRHHVGALEFRPGLTERIVRFCAERRITTSMFHTAVFSILLHRQTGRDDVLVGMPVTVRDPGDAGVVGHLTNTVVLRSRPAPDATAADVLTATRTGMLRMLRHRHAPLSAVVDDLRARGEHVGTAEPFSAMITVMPAGARRLDLPGWGVRTWRYVPGGAKYDLVLVVDEAEDRHTLVVEHTSSAPGAAELTDRFVDRIGVLVERVLDAPDTPLRELDRPDPLADPALAKLARRAAAPALGTECTADLVAAAAAATPTAPALVADGQVIDHAGLAARVDAVAAGLAAYGVRDGRRVGVLLPAGVELVVVVLAVLRAGGAYVVLDPDHPPERTAAVLGDCDPALVVTGGAADRPVGTPDVPVTTAHALAAAPHPGFDPIGRKSPHDSAYVVHTSGSTGRPKGVEITEVTLTNLVRNQDLLSGSRTLRTLQYMTPSFDVFAEEMFGTLCSGGALVLPPATARTDFPALAELLRAERVQRVFLPYAALRELAAVLRAGGPALPELREVYTTGERLVVTDDLRAMFRARPHARLGNVYGPSEAHLCTAQWLPADPDSWPALPPIGEVVPGVDCRVLDGDRPVPVGVEGELCVAGPVVSPGYLGLPDQTARSFVPDPCVPGQRMYRTGDVVVLAPDGRLHCLGRSDDQVKIRGFRVEPAEVEVALERVLGVEAAAVLVDGDGADRSLHGVVAGVDAPPADWRVRLAAALPAHLVPARLSVTDRIPVTSNGKTDRAGLARRLARTGAAAVAAAPTASARVEDGLQARLARLWAEVLGTPPTSADDDFFLLGGHSLLAARLHRGVRERFGTDIPLAALLSTPTLRGMAERLGGTAADAPDLRADAALPAGFTVATAPAADRGDTVLLTGATGFLGVHLLDELVRAGRRVACPVRAQDAAAARERLRAACRDNELDPAVAEAPDVWPADLADADGEPVPADHARGIGEVYHAAAHINFVAPYRSVRRTNVDGLRRILEFCAAGRVPLRLISTLGVFPPDSTEGTVDESTLPGDPASLGIGYSQSKWVGEHLAAAARDAGLPVSVHRIGRIGGHSRTGACRPDDFFWLQMKGVARVGSYPGEFLDLPAVDLLPVDHVARSVRLLSDHDGVGAGSVWHLHHDRGFAWTEVLAVLRAEGHRATRTGRAAWLGAIERSAADGDRTLAPLVPLMLEGVMRLGEHRVEDRRTVAVLARLGLSVPDPDSGWLHRTFDFFRRRGDVPVTAGIDEGEAP